MPARLLQVDVLPGAHRQERRGRVPVIGGRDHERIDILVVERLAKIAQPLGWLGLRTRDGRDALREDLGIHVADVGDGGVRRAGEGAPEDAAAVVQAHHRDHDRLGR